MRIKLIRYYGLYSRRTSAKLQKMLTPLSREKPNVVRRKEVVVCSKRGQIMDLVGVTRPVEDQNPSGYNGWDDDSDS
jgi:hypothetical protein